MAFPTKTYLAVGASQTASSSHTVVIDTGHSVGDLLVVIFAHTDALGATHDPPSCSGWTLVGGSYTVDDGASLPPIWVYTRVVDGTEPSAYSFITSDNRTATWISFRLTGVGGDIIFAGTGTSTIGFHPDSPEVLSLSECDYLFLSAAAWSNGLDNYLTAEPFGFTDTNEVDNLGGPRLATCWYESSIPSGIGLDPDEYTIAEEDSWSAVTVAFKDAGCNNDTSILCDSGEFTTSGIDCSVLHNKSISLGTGSFQIDCFDTSVARLITVGLDVGVFSVDGTSTNVIYNKDLSLGTGDFLIDGIDASILSGISITCEVSSFVVDTNTTEVLVNRSLALDALSVQLSSSDAQVSRDRLFECSTLDITVEAVTSNLLHIKALSLDSGSFLIDGGLLTDGRSIALIADSVSFSVAGEQASFIADKILTADLAECFVDVFDSNVTSSLVIQCEASSFSMATEDTSVTATRLLEALVFNANVSGQSSNIRSNRYLACETLDIALSGIDAMPCIPVRVLFPDSAAFSISAGILSFESNVVINASSGSFSASGNSTGTLASRVLQADTASYTNSGQDIQVNKRLSIQLDSSAYDVDGQNVDFIRSFCLEAEIGEFTFTGTDTIFSAENDVTLTADTTSYSVSGINQDVLYSRLLDADQEQYYINENQTDVCISGRPVFKDGVRLFEGGVPAVSTCCCCKPCYCGSCKDGVAYSTCPDRTHNRIIGSIAQLTGWPDYFGTNDVTLFTNLFRSTQIRNGTVFNGTYIHYINSDGFTGFTTYYLGEIDYFIRQASSISLCAGGSCGGTKTGNHCCRGTAFVYIDVGCQYWRLYAKNSYGTECIINNLLPMEGSTSSLNLTVPPYNQNPCSYDGLIFDQKYFSHLEPTSTYNFAVPSSDWNNFTNGLRCDIETSILDGSHSTWPYPGMRIDMRALT